MNVFLRLLFVALLVGCSTSTTPTVDAAPDAPPPPPFGAACDDSSPCAGGLACIIDPVFPGGYCTTTCDASPCPDGSSCVDDFLTPLCLAACAGDSECRTGYGCWRGTCRPPCSVDSHCGDGDARCVSGSCTGPECSVAGDCASGATCVSGSCVSAPPDAGLPDAPPTGSCSSDAECDGGVCLPPELGGECAARCVDRASCGSSSLVCSPVLRDTTGDGTPDTAVPACVGTEPTGRFLGGACDTVGFDASCESNFCLWRQCTESCDDDSDCMLGMVCRDLPSMGTTASTPVCFYTPGAAGPVVRIPLGELTLSPGLPSRRVNFGVAHDAVSLTLIARHLSGDELDLSFVNVFSPRDETLFDLIEISDLVDQPIRWLPLGSGEAIAMLIPNSTPDRVAFVQGRHGVTLTAFADGPGDTRSAVVELEAVVRRRIGSALDLNVFLVGIGVSASAAPATTRLQNALSEVSSILGARGLNVGTVRYVDVTAAQASTFGVIDSSDGPDSEMSRLFRLSAGQTNNALNVFLVRGISAGAGESGGIALGVAGGIPGPPGVHGTMHSGVVVSYDTSVVGSDFRTVAQIMSHEIGHYLGLFHGTERGRPCSAGEVPSEMNPCSPFGGGDTLADTTRGDGRNLMYFALGGSDGRTYNVQLSSGQGHVIVRNPLAQ